MVLDNIKLTVIFLALMAMSSMVQAAQEGEIAPAVALPLLQDSGGPVSLAEYEGQIVYLDFWASWCPPCLVSMPIMNEIRNRLQDEGIAFEVLAVNVDSDPRDGIDFLLDSPVDFVVLSDPKGTSPAAYGVRGMPTSYLIDPEGKIVMVHEGFKRSDGEKIKQQILEMAGNTQ